LVDLDRKLSLLDKIKCWWKYTVPMYRSYIFSFSFMQSSYDVWKAEYYIDMDRHYFVTNREPDLMPYWSRVERDLDEVYLKKGRVTCADYGEAQNRYRHIANTIIEEHERGEENRGT